MKKTDFDASLEATHKYKGYKNHFKGLYMALKVAGAVLLTISAFLSSRFFGAILEPYLFEASSYAGFIISLLISGLIGKLTGDLLVYWEEHGMAEPTLAGLLILLVAGNAYFDWKGGNEWAYELSGERPVNAQADGIASTYTAQIEGIDAEIDGIEAREFYWCGAHNKAHKCPSAGFYIDPKHDRKHVAKIEELKAQKSSLQNDMSAQLTAASNAYTASLSEYDDRLSGTKTVTKGGSIVCMLLYSFVAFWCHKYGVRAVNEMQSPALALEMTQAEELLALEAKTNRELREELASLKEAIAEGRNMNEPKLSDLEAKK